MSDRLRTVRTAVVLAASSILLAQRARAADRHWYGGLDSGDWQTPAHWKEGVVPTSADNVFIDYPNRTITLSNDVLVPSLTITGAVGSANGVVGLDLGGHRMDVVGAAYVSGMSVAVTPGSVFTASSLELGSAGVVNHGLLMSGGTARFGTAKVVLASGFVGNGTIELTGGSAPTPLKRLSTEVRWYRRAAR